MNEKLSRCLKNKMTFIVTSLKTLQSKRIFEKGYSYRRRYAGTRAKESFQNGHGTIAMIDMQELDEMEKQIALYKFQLAMQESERSVQEEGVVSIDDLKKELGV